MAAGDWYAVYVVATGELASVGQVVASPAQLAAAGLASVDLGAAPPAGVWNPSTLAFGAAPNPPIISVGAFVNRFTAAEWAGVESSANGGVQKIVFVLPTLESINLNWPVVSTFLNGLVTLGILTQARATAIETP